MGHIRLGRLPATKRWQQVVSLLAQGAPLERIAAASAEAAENSLAQANRDPALLRSFWLSDADSPCGAFAGLPRELEVSRT